MAGLSEPPRGEKEKVHEKDEVEFSYLVIPKRSFEG
jgi:hypothetical protein